MGKQDNGAAEVSVELCSSSAGVEVIAKVFENSGLVGVPGGLGSVKQLRTYVGLRDGEVLAALIGIPSVLVAAEQVIDVIWVGGMSVVPAERGKGVAARILKDMSLVEPMWARRVGVTREGSRFRGTSVKSGDVDVKPVFRLTAVGSGPAVGRSCVSWRGTGSEGLERVLRWGTERLMSIESSIASQALSRIPRYEWLRRAECMELRLERMEFAVWFQQQQERVQVLELLGPEEVDDPSALLRAVAQEVTGVAGRSTLDLLVGPSGRSFWHGAVPVINEEARVLQSSAEVRERLGSSGPEVHVSYAATL